MMATYTLSHPTPLNLAYVLQNLLLTGHDELSLMANHVTSYHVLFKPQLVEYAVIFFLPALKRALLSQVLC